MAEMNRFELKTNDFDYHLPEASIARFPLEERDASKLLLWNKGEISHQIFRSLADEIPEDAFLIFNNTKVVPARLHFQKETGAWVEILVLEKRYDIENQKNGWVWECLVGNKKKWQEGEVLSLKKTVSRKEFGLKASWADREKDLVLLTWEPENLGFYEVLSEMGEMPIPPYLQREAQESDKKNYQTVYAKTEGAVAAPTAGLHFTERVFESLRKRGIAMGELTLHVGLGTFRPMKSKRVAEHEMHPEKVVVSRNLIEKLANHTGPVFAVGTTSIRSLESLYWLGTECMEKGQFPEFLHTEQPYEWQNRKPESRLVFRIIKEMMEEKKLSEIQFSTQLYLMPGYSFRVVKGLITNFHQPKSTLMVLVSSFIGEDWKKLYQAALENNYRFLSYGDSSLLIPKNL
jgi:S-adenosylmethionine:tRNA ribosyltransferase-isomerase